MKINMTNESCIVYIIQVFVDTPKWNEWTNITVLPFSMRFQSILHYNKYTRGKSLEDKM